MAKRLGKSSRQPIDDFYNYSLRDTRIKAGYSTKELAEKVGISASMISHYERLRALPSPSVAEKLAEILNKETNKLFPEKLKGYLRQIRKERRKKQEDVLDSSQPLPKNLQSTMAYEEPFLGGLTLEKIQKRLRKEIKQSLSNLSYREREIIKLRYGIGDGYSYTLKEVGQIFKVTRERIRQIEIKAVRKLQQPSRVKSLIDALRTEFG